MKNTLYTLALLVSFSSFGQTAEDYFKSGYYKESDHYGAISDYIKAIELNPNNDEMSYIDNNGEKFYFSNHHAYFNIAVHKDDLKDYYGAISDYTKAIELNPNFTKAYKYRGHSKNDLKDYYGAISDYTKTIELDPNFADAYRNIGIAKEQLGDLKGACKGFKKAAELGDTEAAEWVANQCN